VLGGTVNNRWGLLCNVKHNGKVHTCCCGGQGDGERQRGTTCTVRRELLDLFLQVVCGRGQLQVEEGGFFPSKLLGDELTFLVETETTDTTKNRPHITTRWTQKQHQMDDIHLCIPTNQENYKPLQTH